MAEIRSYPFVSHARSAATDHLVHVRRGRVVKAGAGQSFWFRAANSVLSEVPVDDRELSMLFHARTADYQDVTVQATVGYRFADPGVAAGRIDFGLDLRTGRWRGGPLEQIAQLLTELAQQHVLELLAGTPLAAAITSGTAQLRQRMATGLAGDERLERTGIAVIDVRVTALRPEGDVERALQTPARELIQAEADRATYERRAFAVERERAISENELQSKIELAVREERLVTQRGTNERRRATEAAAAQRIETEAKADQAQLLAASRAGTTTLIGAAEAEAEAARMAVYQQMDTRVLLALAVRDAAANLPQIGALTLSPDVITGALARLADLTPAAGTGA